MQEKADSPQRAQRAQRKEEDTAGANAHMGAEATCLRSSVGASTDLPSRNVGRSLGRHLI